ncbi:Ger(x)C family spore germination protein [Paenibacillus albiflavus]|uniref:Ger(X)C family spore germination protein n=1 Tax=Paenibacillus albiflavus TaxID=2545760 RepID=A0A4R4ERA7_9BACL|nr:Ger(x)C family spore germination protein [Paenibacillus albiflavus]TCZ80958.1 Ger(x)C family spore germination protein [Paenibacillus albiflavus]
MKRICVLCAVIFILLIVNGCWDQDLLKNARLLYGEGIDLAPNGKLRSTFVIRDMPPGEQQSPKNDIIYTVGNTLMETREHADEQVSRHLVTYRNRIILIGEELAKQDIYPILETFYRDPKSALNARIGVTKGTAANILSLKKVGNVLIGEEIDELIKSREETTTVPKVTLENIYSVMLDPGEDFVLPYLIEEGGRVKVARIALFHDNKLTGQLSPDESTMYLLLKDRREKLARFTRKINAAHEGRQNRYNFLTFSVDKLKRKMTVQAQSDDRITVKLDLNMKLSVIEYPKDHLDKEKVLAELNQYLSKEMTDLAKETLRKIQEARCDGLGIGRELRAFHPDIWKKQKDEWGSNYQKVDFIPAIQVQITKKGVLN